MAWSKRRDPLFRGDHSGGVSHPTPGAALSIVEHVLYLGGPGRESQFHSTTESSEFARHFALPGGLVYKTSAPRAEAHSVVHIAQVELKRLLRGKGQGKAKWRSALEVMQARRYIEQWAEHLLDFEKVSTDGLANVAGEIYEE
jgi:hypothetical protein